MEYTPQNLGRSSTLQQINSVLGEIATSQLGSVLIHEHILSLTPGAGIARIGGDHYDDFRVDIATSALLRAKQSGINTVVDVSPHGVVGREPMSQNVGLLKLIQQNTNVNILVGTGTYIDEFNPSWVSEISLHDLAKRYISDITVGISGTDVKASLIGEQATGLNVISPNEEKCLKAAANAQRETGVALMTHTTHGTMALEQIEVLKKEGVNLSKVIIGHMDINPDLDYVKRVLDSGANVAFDTIGKENWDFFLRPQERYVSEGDFKKNGHSVPDSLRANRISQLVESGYIDQIVISHDVTGAEMFMNPETHGKFGYSYINEEFVHMLLNFGVSEEQFIQLLDINTKRILTPEIGQHA